MKGYTSYLEFIVILVISVAIFSGLFFLGPSILENYNNLGVNREIFNFSGVLFGLFLTAYAIFASLIPASKKEFLKTTIFSRVEQSFIMALLVTMSTVVLSFLIFFTEGLVKNILIYLQITFFIASVLLSIIITLALCGIIRYMKQTLIATREH